MKRLKICCRKLEDNLEAFDINFGISISTSDEHWWQLDNVKYCPFCGEELEIDYD